jgi:hypothetical protein
MQSLVALLITASPSSADHVQTVSQTLRYHDEDAGLRSLGLRKHL